MNLHKNKTQIDSTTLIFFDIGIFNHRASIVKIVILFFKQFSAVLSIVEFA